MLPDSGFHLVYSKQKNRDEFHIYNLNLGDKKGEDFSYKGLDVKYRFFLLLSPLLSFCIVSILLSVEILALLTIPIVIIIIISIILAELLLPLSTRILPINDKSRKVFSLIVIYKEIKRKFWNLQRKTLLKSLIYSVDSIIPIIEFDQELNNFITTDSPDWFEIYFIVHKILGIVSLAILLPILLIMA